MERIRGFTPIHWMLPLGEFPLLRIALALADAMVIIVSSA
jgi:hypothetical protein